MPPQPSQGNSRPITSFSFAPATASASKGASNAKSGIAPAASSNGSREGKQNLARTGVSDGREQTGAQIQSGAASAKPLGGLRPLGSFAPKPVPRASTSKAAHPKATPKPLNRLAAPPPRPSPSPSLSTGKPPLKRQKRVLATAEELSEWSAEDTVEHLRIAKGKGRAIEEERRTDSSREKRQPPPTTAKAAPSIPEVPFHPLASTFGVFSPAVKQSRELRKHPISATKARASGTPAPSPAMHRLSSFSPFPSSSSTPVKPQPSASQATPVTHLFGQLSTPAKREADEQKPFERRSILALAPSAPPTTTGDEAANEGAEGGQRWSPGKKGKKGGYLLSGIASRVAALLNSAKTNQTLWLHDFSRSLGSLSLPAPIPDLFDTVPPSLRLKIVSVPSSSPSSEHDSNGRRGNKTLLAQCRIELDQPPPSSVDPSSTPTPDLVGLVLFSLHSFASSASLAPPPPVKPRKPPEMDDGRRSLHVPTNPHDLQRFLSRGGDGGEGVEVWVWEPFYPVDLLPESEMGSLAFSGEVRVAVKEETAAEGDGVEWDEEREQKRAEAEREARAADRRKKALVVGRFAVLV